MDDLNDEKQREWLRELKHDFRNPICPDTDCAHPSSLHAAKGMCLQTNVKRIRNSKGFVQLLNVRCSCDLSAEDVFENRRIRSEEQLRMIDHAVDYGFSHGVWPTSTANQKQIPSDILSNPCEPGEIPDFPGGSMHQKIDEGRNI